MLPLMGAGILQVDLLRFERGDRAARRAVVDGVMRSLETGFVTCGHDVPEGVVDEAYAALEAFFRRSRADKEALVVEGSHGQTGYTGLLVETAAHADRPDFKEMLNWGRELPDGHPLRRRYPHRYRARRLPGEGAGALALLYDRLEDLQRRFLRIVAEGLGAHARYFDRMLDDGPTLCRAIRYPPMGEAPDGDFVWADAHEDINLVTALPRATARGLQVRVDGAWVDAVAPAGHAILNTGMMLAHVSNGRVPAGTHRVVAGPEQRGERLSVVQFCHPTPSTILAPVPAGPADPLRGPPVVAGDWLDQVLFDINLVEDARRIRSGAD
jgi:isopenicillin N synthase-like dioxygenase